MRFSVYDLQRHFVMAGADRHSQTEAERAPFEVVEAGWSTAGLGDRQHFLRVPAEYAPNATFRTSSPPCSAAQTVLPTTMHWADSVSTGLGMAGGKGASNMRGSPFSRGAIAESADCSRRRVHAFLFIRHGSSENPRTLQENRTRRSRGKDPTFKAIGAPTLAALWV